MNNKQIAACVDYINQHARALHGLPSKAKETLVDITTENVVKAVIVGDEAVLLVDRGVKGMPKYHLSLADVEKNAPPPKPQAEEVKAAPPQSEKKGR